MQCQRIVFFYRTRISQIKTDFHGCITSPLWTPCLLCEQNHLPKANQNPVSSVRKINSFAEGK